MKKILLFCISLFYFSGAHAIALQNLPNDFQSHCFEYSAEITSVNIQAGNVYKLMLSQSDDLVLTQGDILLPHKKYAQGGSLITYNNSLGYDFATLTDDNSKTSVELDTDNGEIVLEFDSVVLAGSFDFNFKHSPVSWMQADFYVSQDGSSYSQIVYNGVDSLEKYDIKKLKINFTHISGNRDKFDISELSFTRKYDIYLFRPAEEININLYSGFDCKQGSVPRDSQAWSFDIDINTPTLLVNFTRNPGYNPQTSLDSDGDGIDNVSDNCRNIYNPDQADSNGDRKGDLCSDDDRDGVLGHKDNCIANANADQLDVNRNGVGDVCEFDKDGDGVFDSLDNCITISNVDQIDSDRDNIGNACDNCKYYNPRQLDTDKNEIGDICDAKRIYLLENDEDKDEIEDNRDNCRQVANPDQADFDKDSIGDVCDNCRNIQNKDQKDENENGVGDMCEDSDGDGIQGIQDNCLNIANADQRDSDNNGIGDLCEDSDGDKILFINDNCPYKYNPDQSNIDDDELGDKCDDDDNRYIESNKGFFIAIAVLFALLFIGGIGFMFHKLNTNPKG